MKSKSKTVVISQSMYFPWCGLLDQIRLADVFVHYDDVQLSRGFYNRVQVKTSNGSSYITVPIKNRKQKQLIDQSYISYETNWVDQHRAILLNSYRHLPFIKEALDLFDTVHDKKYDLLSDLSRASIKILAEYFQLDNKVQFINSADLSISGSSSQRLLMITKKLGGNTYLTGHGALKYLDHTLFEDNGIEVKYVDYCFKGYKQVHGTFTPYVTALDAIAHLGTRACDNLLSTTINWRKAIE